MNRIDEPRIRKPLRAVKKSKRTVNDLEQPDDLLSFRIDWRRYFRDFDAAHGGNPVEIDGRLVWEDGWSYSSHDYRGPEWPPPERLADLNALLLKYWTAIKADAGAQLKQMREAKRTLLELARTHSQPLHKKVKLGLNDQGMQQWDHQRIEADAVTGRLAWLEDLVARADKNIWALLELARTHSGLKPQPKEQRA